MRADVGETLRRLGIQARKVGREWLARCPNPGHEDRNPSWRVRDEPGHEKHGYHHCHACGFSGGLVGLVADVLEIAPREARAWLGGDEDVEDRRPPPPPPAVALAVSRRGFAMPVGVEFAPLARWPTPPRRFAERRGVTAAQVDRWGLGYAVEGRLEGRVVVPYRTPDGAPRGYTARTYGSHPKRYKEADAKERPDRAAMFGEQHWPARGERLLVRVTEGALNALAVERAAGGAVAAIAGSGLREQHAAKLASFERVVVLTDPDAAGDKAAAEILAAVGRHCEVSRVRLPEGTDANDLPEEILREALLESGMRGT